MNINTLHKTRNKNNNEYKKRLIQLTLSITRFLNELDKAMSTPATYERGKRIARLTNYLDGQNDAAMHFTLGYSFEKIGKLKQSEREER